ncbi:hypothetical protein ACFX2K_013518 [Malus domestica]
MSSSMSTRFLLLPLLLHLSRSLHPLIFPCPFPHLWTSLFPLPGPYTTAPYSSISPPTAPPATRPPPDTLPPVPSAAPSQHTHVSSHSHAPPPYLKDYVCSKVMLPPHPSSLSPPSSIKGMQYPLCNYVSYHHLSPHHLSYIYSVSRGVEPSTFVDSASDPNWRCAMNEELDALHANSTWTMTTLPSSKVPINCKWVYKLKRNSEGSIERYKARLVAKGFTLAEGIDYHDTFSPTAKMITVRFLFALAATQSWSLHQVNVNNAFLHGDLDKEIYMSHLPGLRRQGENLVCHLHKSLYGLK